MIHWKYPGSADFLTKGNRQKWAVEEIILLICCTVTAVLIFVRCFFGVEFTDEAYYVSDTLAIIHGNIPYAYNTCLVAGQSFVPIVFYKIYEFFVPSFEGIFLYSRLCYVLFRLVILLALYHLLKHELARKWRLLILLAMIPFMGSFVQQNFSYNTIAAYCTLLVSVLLYSAQKDNGKKQYVKFVFSGFVSAISVFAHPVSAFAVIVNFFLILLNSEKTKKLKCLSAYCFGGILQIIIVFLPIIYTVGIEKLLFGLETTFFYGLKLEKKPLLDRLVSVLQFSGSYCGILLFGALSSYLAVILLAKRNKSLPIPHIDKWLLSLCIALCITLCIAFYKIPMKKFWYLCGILFTETCLLMLPAFKRHAYAWYLFIPNFLYIGFLVISTRSNVDRFYFAIPLCIVILLTMFQSKSNAVKGSAVVLAILFTLMQGYEDYKFVYRDESLPYLNTRVEQGVYKGMYTTPERARDVVELENYLIQNIDLQDSVSFRDNAPVAYLMRNKNICDIRTWDNMQWSYGMNNPVSMYRYYKNKGEIPDVIVYVDFGRDPELSIDSPSEAFQYNNFVNNYYYLDAETLENQTFRVKIYRNNKSFQYDFDRLIASVK